MAEDKKAKNSKLGKGLSALIGEYDAFDEADSGVGAGSDAVAIIGIATIKPNPNQPRKAFDEEKLEELTQSVKVKGVLTPILIRPVVGEDNDYQIIAGERRYRAAKRAGLSEIPARVLETNEVELLEIGLIENIQRENLNAIEEAEGYQALINRFGKTQESLATAVGKSRAHVANLLRLLNLPEGALDLVRSGAVSAGHARAALGADDPEALLNEVIDRKLSVRDTEKRVAANVTPPSGGSSVTGDDKDVDTAALEADLSRTLGLTVDIKSGKRGGELRIKYRDLEQLDDVCRRLSRTS